MKKLASTLPNMLLSLVLISAVISGIVAGVYLVTKKPIEEANLKKQQEAIKQVTPAFDNNPVAEAFEVKSDLGNLKVFPSKKEGKVVGYAIESLTKKGFSGEIKIMFGFTPDGVVKDFSVLEHAETPGLGAKLQDWFHQTEKEKPGFQGVIGVNMDQTPDLKVKKDGGSVDAITAATISSRAFLDALDRAHKALEEAKNHK